MVQHSNVSSQRPALVNHALGKSLRLKCGITISNRICKPATSEHMADIDFNPTKHLCRVYSQWSRGGAGLLITGNIMIDREFREGTRNCVLDEYSDLSLYRQFAYSAKAGGSVALAQISHPGRQCPTSVTYSQPLAPSVVKFRIPAVGIQLFRTPRELELFEIEDLVKKFAFTCSLATENGFDGVQIHGAHGYLISQFLSPRTNHRRDKYGGSPEKRSQFLLDIVKSVRIGIGPNKILAVKINSQDFSLGGFKEEDSFQVIEMLAPLVDIIEISGGTYEDLKFMAQDSGVNSMFCNFAKNAKNKLEKFNLPLMVTGGFRDCAIANAAIESNNVDIVGVCRPLCIDPQLPRKWLAGENNPQSVIRFNVPYFKALFIPGQSYFFHQYQLHRISKKRQTEVNLSYPRIMKLWLWDFPFSIVRMYIWDFYTRPQPIYFFAAVFSFFSIFCFIGS